MVNTRRGLSAVIFVAVVLAACSTAEKAADVTATPAPSTSSTTTTTAPAVTTTAPAPPLTLRQGDTGTDVETLQRSLMDRGYWLADDPGTFGMTTAHAVTAFQKQTGLARDGVAGPLTLDALRVAIRPMPHRADGHHVEIDLVTQTMLLVERGSVQWVFDVSTGARPGTTPKGEFAVFRQVDGYDHGPLGTLYRPKYFSRGVAVHGFPSVPAQPASHGCVRVVNAAMDYLWETDALPVGTTVLVY